MLLSRFRRGFSPGESGTRLRLNSQRQLFALWRAHFSVPPGALHFRKVMASVHGLARGVRHRNWTTIFTAVAAAGTVQRPVSPIDRQRLANLPLRIANY